jgi:hypothetical protein
MVPERPLSQVWQPAAKAVREIDADLPNLFLRNIKVVEQPFISRGDGPILADGRLNASIRVEEHPAVGLEPFGEVSAGSVTGRDMLGAGEALSMLLEALDAEEFTAD